MRKEVWDNIKCEECKHFWESGESLHFRRCLFLEYGCVDCSDCGGKDFEKREKEMENGEFKK